MRKAMVAVLVTSLALGGMAVLPAPASAWTWSSAKCPIGSVSGGEGGGILKWRNHYYVPSVGHTKTVLGENQWDYTCGGTGFVGHTAYTTYNNGAILPDVALMGTGTDPLPKRMRVSNGWTNAAITDIAHGNGDLPNNASVCHSGMSSATQGAGGYRCGQLKGDCVQTMARCEVQNAEGIVQGGDSGGPVWWYHPNGGIKLIGWMSNGLTPIVNGSYTGALFQPTWALFQHTFTASQSWTDRGFEPGQPSSTGACFVTTQGCLTP